jgi:hypothetical protein
MTLVRLPPRRLAAVFLFETGDGWLVLAPRGHGWLHGSLEDAMREAKWLAQNWSVPVREVARG